MNSLQPVAVDTHPTPLKINFLGMPHAVLPDGERIQFQLDNTLLMMAYLGANPGKEFLRADLASIFYPDHDEKRANQNIRQTIHRLRKLLKDDQRDVPGLLVGATTIRIHPQGPVETDIQQFNVNFNSVQQFIRQHSHRRLEICRTCTEKVEALVELYTGEFLDGFFPHTNGSLDEWVPMIRQDIQNKLIGMMHTLSKFYFERQQYDRCSDYLNRIMACSPLDEAALRTNMKILTIAGQRNQALLCYHDFQRNLQQDLDIPPEEETILLAQLIRAGKVILDNRTLPYINNLPFANHEIDGSLLPDTTLPFIGRKDEIRQITDLLDSSDQRVIVIKGVIGSGKTRLAMHVASLENSAWTNGIYQVLLNAHHTLHNNLVSALVHTLNVPSNNSSEHRKNLVSFLREKECLILIDNLDEIPDQAEVIQLLVNQCPKVKVIITTRKHLGIRSEKVIYFNGLDYPSLDDLQASGVETGQISIDTFIKKYNALQLFKEIATRARADFVVDPTNLANIIQTCAMLIGLPLGIELAASYVRMFNCEKIRDGVYGCLNGIEGVSTFIADRHGNFKKRFELVWESLNQTERELVRIVARYTDGVVTDDLLAANLTTIETLVTLQDKSTLIRLPGSRVKLHPLVRFFCNQ